MAELLRVEKNKSVISFEIINGDKGRLATYDLKDGSCTVDGKERKSLQLYFSQINRPYSRAIDEVLYKTENETKEFFDWMARHFSGCTNFNTLLERMSQCSKQEEWFSFNKEKSMRLGIPQSLLSEFTKPEKKKLNNDDGFWDECVDYTIKKVRKRIALRELNDKYEIILKSDSNYNYDTHEYEYIYTPELRYTYDYDLMDKVIEDFNLDILKERLEYYTNFEGLERSDALQNLIDYFDMIKQMGKDTTKYPSNLLTAHKVIEKTHKIWVQQFEDELFKEKYDKTLEYTQQIKYKEKDEEGNSIIKYKDGDYCIIAPESTKDVKEEGINNHNCVASYIPRILKDETLIYFGRKVSDKAESLMTIEVKDGVIVQALGQGNKHLKEDEREFIKEWAKAKDLKIRVYYIN